MMSPTITALIAEMQEVKQTYPTLDIQDVLKLFEIKTTKELITKLELLRVSFLK